MTRVSRLASTFALVLAALAGASALPAHADTEVCTNCITFSADKAFGICLLRGTDMPPYLEKNGYENRAPAVSLEWSTDQKNWASYSQTLHDDHADPTKGKGLYPAVLDSDGLYKLHIRGTGNTHFGSGASGFRVNRFTNTIDSVATQIKCSGNVETIFDYKTVARGEHPPVEDYMCAFLFRRFTTLTEAPDLMFTNITYKGCENMFGGCTSLIRAPRIIAAKSVAPEGFANAFKETPSLKHPPERIDAMNLTSNAFYYAFNDSAVPYPPDLPATNLVYRCYYYMFTKNNNNMKIDTTGPGKAWSIPAAAAESAKTAFKWSEAMFTNTASSIEIQQKIEAGKTYYFSTAPKMDFTVAAVTGASVTKVMEEIWEVTGNPSYSVYKGNNVKVTYTADSGYMFPVGTTTFTKNFKASDAVTTATVPENERPVPIRYLSNVELVDTTTTPWTTNATAKVFVGENEMTQGADGSFGVPEGAPLKIVYTLTDENKLFDSCTKYKVLWREDGITADYAMTDADKKTVLDAISDAWVEGEAGGREIALDTRERIVVAAPEEVLAIAYSTNFWGEAEGSVAGMLGFYDPQGELNSKLPFTASGYTLWQPPLNELGKYAAVHACGNGKNIMAVTNAIYYSQPYELTVNAAEEGGTIEVITNGAPATGTFDVLGYEYVSLKATPEGEKWQFTQWSAVTNGGEVALFWDETHPTNRFEMPFANVTVSGGFVIAEAYRAALFEAATNAYVAATNSIETLRNNRLSEGETDGALNNALGAFNTAVGSLSTATKPYEADAATNTLVGALAKAASDAAAVSANKPWTITVDANAVADGTNVFNTIDAAFAATDFLPYATNLVVIGEQRATTAMPAMTRKWNLVVSNWTSAVAYDSTKSPYKQTRLVFGANAQTTQFYSKLDIVKGEGRILVDKANAGWEQFWGTLVGKRSVADNVEVYGALQTQTLANTQTSGEQIAINNISLKNIDITNETAFAAPVVSQAEGTFGWSLLKDNHKTYLASYDDVAFDGSVELQIRLDSDQTEGNVVTNYVIAGLANAANGKTFKVKNLMGGNVCELTVGGDTRYVGPKAYTLALVEDDENVGTSNLVFDVAWGKFAIAYEPAGGKWSDGTASTNIDAYVNKGYEFPAENPTRAGYAFAGWYRSWTNGAEKVTALDIAASPVLPLEEHALYAKWTPVQSSDDSRLSDLLPNGEPRVEITTADGFRGSRTLKTLNMPLYVTRIGQQAFQGALALTTVNFVRPRKHADFSVTTLVIEDYAFIGCTSLETVTIPSCVETVGKNAFSSCTRLKDIYILGDVDAAVFGDKPFAQCGTRVGGLTVHLSPAAAANAALVAKITNGATARIVVDARLAGEVQPDAYSEFTVTETEITFKVNASVLPENTPVNAKTVSALFSQTPSGVGEGEVLLPKSVSAKDGAGDYTVVFPKPKAATGFLRLSVNPQNDL